MSNTDIHVAYSHTSIQGLPLCVEHPAEGLTSDGGKKQKKPCTAKKRYGQNTTRGNRLSVGRLITRWLGAQPTGLLVLPLVYNFTFLGLAQLLDNTQLP